jgi:hypothetical protein
MATSVFRQLLGVQPRQIGKLDGRKYLKHSRRHSELAGAGGSLTRELVQIDFQNSGRGAIANWSNRFGGDDTRRAPTSCL